MTELIFAPAYLLVLIAGSLYFHARHRCIRASCATGFLAAWAVVIAICAIEERSTNPLEYLGAFLYAGIGIWIFSAVLSGFIGAAIQIKKD